MAADAAGGGAGGGGAAAFDGKLTEWPEKSLDTKLEWPEEGILNVCNVPTEQKAFIRYFACEWMKNQPYGNTRLLAQQAIQSAQTLYSELLLKGYMKM